MNEKNACSENEFYTIMLGIGKKKQSKYRAKRTMNADGTFSDSKKEARHDAEFMAMAKNKGVLRVVRKERFTFVLNGVKLCAYESDWTVYYKDGRKEVFDAKGVRTPVYKIKKKIMKAFFNIDIQEV
jgi:hypothetical protein